MAKYLYKLGKWSAINRKKVVALWMVLLLTMVGIAMAVGPSFDEDMTIPNTQSAEAGKLIESAFPTDGSEDGTVQLVMKAPENETLTSEKIQKTIDETLESIKEDAKVTAVASPVELSNLNENETIGYATVTYNQAPNKVTDASKESLLKKIEQTREAGIQTDVAGNVAFSEVEIGGISEAVGVIVAFLVLAITFSSFLLAGMPILTAIIGLGIGLMGIILATNVLDITSFSLSLAAMLGLAVGIDYALFIFSRYRLELKNGRTTIEAIAIANGTAGSSVVFAGLTVIIALLGLSIANIPFLTMMGVSAALCVLIAILLAIILVPALLALLGSRAHPSRTNRLLAKLTFANKAKEENRWGQIVMKYPKLMASSGIILLMLLSIPFFHMELGLPDNGSKPANSTERKAYDLLSEAYGAGIHGSLVIALKPDKDQGLSEETFAHINEQLSDLNHVKSVSPAIPGENNISMISITPTSGPNDKETKDLVHNIRELSNDLTDVTLLVTGATAVNVDITDNLNNALPLFAGVIIVFAFLLMVVVFRSILVPLKAVAGFLLSLGATLGFAVLVLQDGFLANLLGFDYTGPVLAFLPVILIGILFGLAMDYEVFLVSRMREEYTHSKDAKKAILVGMKESGGVVTAAGLIMIAVFFGFMLAPDPIIKSMGFALTFGVLFDAFIVRMTIVPAIMKLLGDSAWYLPKWLDKLIPNIDIEGESLKDINKHEKTFEEGEELLHSK